MPRKTTCPGRRHALGNNMPRETTCPGRRHAWETTCSGRQHGPGNNMPWKTTCFRETTFPGRPYEQFSVAADFNCSNTTKMGFCKCRHLLTVKSIFLIFFMHLNWLGRHLNLKYERKLKIFKIFHKSRNFRVEIFETKKLRDL